MNQGQLFTVNATPVKPPKVVARSQWPVHVTILGNFQLGVALGEAVLASWLSSIARPTPVLSVRLGPRAEFGADKMIPVLLAEDPSFHVMHRSLAREMGQLADFEAAEPSSWDVGYRPHATLGPAVEIAEGDVLPIRWLALWSLLGNRAERIAAFPLFEPDSSMARP